MATITGLTQLKVILNHSSVEAFKVKVKKIVTSMNSYKMIFLKSQQANLVNPNLRDGNTNFPHIRTGNLMRNLIQIKMDKFNENKFKESSKKISYTFNTLNSLDGGNSTRRTVYRKNKRGDKFYYAQFLNEGGKSANRQRYKGYFGRLQEVFYRNYIAKFRETINLYK